jgi:hypothetical protein
MMRPQSSRFTAGDRYPVRQTTRLVLLAIDQAGRESSSRMVRRCVILHNPAMPLPGVEITVDAFVDKKASNRFSYSAATAKTRGDEATEAKKRLMTPLTPV